MNKLEFYTARYCGKCRALKRRLNELKSELFDIELVFIDIDVERSRAKNSNIDGVPTLIYYKNEAEVIRITGSIYEEDILKLIAKENK